jgi:hypothetical protein
MAQIDLKDATVKIKDNGGSNEITVTVGEGNLTFSEKRNMDYILDRGTLDEVREGDEVPIDVSFDFKWDYISGTSSTGGAPSVEEALKKIGNASSWVSTDSDLCRPYSVDIEIFYNPDCATGDLETITLGS